MIHVFIYAIGFLLSIIVFHARYKRAGFDDVDAPATACLLGAFWPLTIPAIYALHVGRVLGKLK